LPVSHSNKPVTFVNNINTLLTDFITTISFFCHEPCDKHPLVSTIYICKLITYQNL